MELNEALDKLARAGLIAEETTEDALARMAANSNEAIVEEIVDEIEKVRPVKNYYEVDPDKSVSQQFEIVMENATWEVQFSRSGFPWGGNVYPWRIIQNNNGGFTKVAHSMSGLRAYMKKVKAIQSESVIAEASGWTAQDVIDALYGKFDPDFGGLNGWSCNVGPSNTVFVYHKGYTFKVSIKPSKQTVELKVYSGKAQFTGRVFDFIEFDSFQSYMQYIIKYIRYWGK